MRAVGKFVSLGAGALVALLAAGCLGGSITDGSSVGDTCTPTLALKPASLTLAPGQSGTMAASVTATCAISHTINWIVTDTSVARATFVNDTTATILAGRVGTTGIVASLVVQPNVIAPGTIFVQQ